jgi:hypothetical protein
MSDARNPNVETLNYYVDPSLEVQPNDARQILLKLMDLGVVSRQDIVDVCKIGDYHA